jgi:predicted negative regulator of RcsB-dependent stress response
MTEKRIKEVIKKPDAVQTSFKQAIEWVRLNPSASVVIAVLIALIAISAWGYTTFNANKNEKFQYALSQGMSIFEMYASTGKAEDLAKAEAVFKTVAQKNSGGTGDVARLYLARISTMRGNAQEAQNMYRGLLKSSSSDTIKKLAESGVAATSPGK